MIKGKITNYGLYGTLPLTVTADFFKVERIETTSKPHDWRIKPHIHSDLVQLFLIEQGQGQLLLTQESVMLDVPCALVMPANTLHGFKFSPEVSGYVITLSERFMEGILTSSPTVSLMFNTVKIVSATLEASIFEELIKIIGTIEEELFSQFEERKQVLESLFTILFIKMYRLCIIKKEAQRGEEVRNINYFRRFQKSLRNSPINTKTVAEFARELAITTVHLNRICQAVAGKPTSQIIQIHSVNEACKYLLHTSYSVSEIANLLNFEDLGYFSRLIKKHLGKSPVKYRAELSNVYAKF